MAAGACARGADTSRLWELLSDLLHKGRVPDSITFKGAISALSKNGEWQQSLKVNPPPPPASLLACAEVTYRPRPWRARCWPCMHAWSLTLRCTCLPPGVPRLMRFWVRRDARLVGADWRAAAVQLFLSMCEQSKVAEGATCLALIGTCAKARQWQLAEEVFLCTIARDLGIAFVDAIGPPDTATMADADRAILRRLQAWRRSGGTALVRTGDTPVDTPAAGAPPLRRCPGASAQAARTAAFFTCQFAVSGRISCPPERSSRCH